MMDIIVVEDKHPILRSIVRKIEHYSSALKVIGEASDGLSGLEMILRFKPAIVITDIRIPGIDGLELIAEAKKVLPDTIYVILTGYNEFDYAKQAIKLGVSEYLLKPVTQTAIDDMLSKVIDLASTSRQAKEHELLTHMLRLGTAAIQPSTNDILRYDRYEMMVLCAGSFSKFTIDLAHPYHTFWMQHDLGVFLTPYLTKDDACWVFDGPHLNEAILVLGYAKHSTSNMQHLAELVLSRYAPAEAPISIAISNPVTKLSGLKAEYQVTRSKLQKQARYGKSSCFHAKDITLDIPDHFMEFTAFDESKIASFIKNNKKDAFMNELQLSLSRWEQEEFSQLQVESGLQQIVHMAHRVTLQHTQSLNTLKLELNEIISISKNYTSLSHNLTFLFEKFFSLHIPTERNSTYTKDMIGTVEQYLKDHLAEEISIHNLADQVNLNVSYLSREFKKQMGISPIEYLTQLRIEKAKELLLAPTELMLKDIAILVGYQNQYYFSKVFKLITGLSPSKYKMTHHSN